MAASSGVYLSIKLNALADRLLLTSKALRQSLARDAVYGEYATQEEILEAGMACAICQVTLPSADEWPQRLVGIHDDDDDDDDDEDDGDGDDDDDDEDDIHLGGFSVRYSSSSCCLLDYPL